jgi:hypothetical protein
MQKKMKTETFIELLINDNQSELIKLYLEKGWKEYIEFDLVYEKVQDLNNPSINNILGYMYRHGYGVDKNNEKAIYHYELSANKGNIIAYNNLGNLYQQDKNYEKALFYYRLAVDKGDSHAINNLGNMYQHGYGVDKNYEKALFYYRLAVDKGDSHAINNLGYMYQHGYGVDKNNEKALFYYQLAVDKGNGYANNNLGYMYKRGLGVDKNDEKSVYHYQLAADQNDHNAQHNLGYIYEQSKNYEKAIYYYSLANEKDEVKLILNNKNFDNREENIIKIIKEHYEMKNKIKEQEKKIMHLKYKPNGIGFDHAKEHFNSLV